MTELKDTIDITVINPNSPPHLIIALLATALMNRFGQTSIVFSQEELDIAAGNGCMFELDFDARNGTITKHTGH